jgi:hypothetical protein
VAITSTYVTSKRVVDDTSRKKTQWEETPGSALGVAPIEQAENLREQTCTYSLQ